MSECGIRWLAVARKIIIAQKTRVPNIPSGKKVMNIVPPMKSTSIRIGVRKPQIGHMAKMMLRKSSGLFSYLKKQAKPRTAIKGISLGCSFSKSMSFPFLLFTYGRYKVRYPIMHMLMPRANIESWKKNMTR